MSQLTDQPAKLPNIGEQLPHLKGRITLSHTDYIKPSFTFSGRQINISRRSAEARDARNTLVGLCRTWNITELTHNPPSLCIRIRVSEKITSLHYNRKKREAPRSTDLLNKKLRTSVSKFDYLREIL